MSSPAASSGVHRAPDTARERRCAALTAGAEREDAPSTDSAARTQTPIFKSDAEYSDFNRGSRNRNRPGPDQDAVHAERHIPREPTEYQAERAIAERLVDLVAGKLPWPDIDVERALPWVEKQSGLSLAPSQAEAVRLALASKAIVITGGPGVGKTTLVDAILRILAAKRVELVLCAPTGRAARRMSEATELEARTIHRLLRVDPATGGFRRDADNPLDCGLLVVDEASMIMAAINRVRIDGKPVVQTRRTTSEGKDVLRARLPVGEK